MADEDRPRYVIEVESCACGGHALEHADEWDRDAEEWVESLPGCSGWRLARTTRSEYLTDGSVNRTVVAA